MTLRALGLLLLLLLLPLLLSPPLFAADLAPPRLMLATSYPPGTDVSEYWVSEKLDGVRGRWDGRRLHTRAGLPIDPPAWFTARWPAVAMDGELWIGRGRFDEVSGLVRGLRADNRAWRRVRFMVFDLPDDPGPFEARAAHLRSLLQRVGLAWLQPVPQFRVASAEALDARLKVVDAAGGEGLMLQHRDARYLAGRSAQLLKLKTYDDTEARVVGHTAGRGKYAGMLGALIVQRPDGTRLRLGSGLTDAQRATPPPIGSLVTYRYNGLTAKGTPRFARFMRVRHDPPPPDPR